MLGRYCYQAFIITLIAFVVKELALTNVKVETLSELLLRTSRRLNGN
ncbi:hypothetical protein ALT1644_10249 [Alteromonas macleodii]